MKKETVQILSHFTLALGLTASMSCAAPLKAIKIEGNQRIESETILSYVPIKQGEEFMDDRLDETLKALYATGYFADVRVERSGDTMVIHLTENPIINRLAYEGNSKLKDEILEKEITIRPREVLTKARIQEAQQHILEIYRHMGRYGASVNPKIVKLPQGRVDLIFEINEGDITYIRKISFIGNKTFHASALEECIKSRRKQWFRFLATDDIYDPERFAADQQELRKFYYDHGFPDVRILSALAELSPDQQGFFLTFSIEEGEHYDFGKCTVSTAFKNVDVDRINQGLSSIEGREFSGALIEQIIRDITVFMGNQGYAFVSVSPVVTKDPKTKRVSIVFDVKEGPKAYIEKIVFQGNDRTRDHVLRRELNIREGDAYNSELIKNAKRDLENLNFFKKVEVEPQPGSAQDQVQLVAKVTEQPTGEIGFNMGYSTEDGPMAQIKFSERNLMGTGRRLHTEFTVAKKAQGFDIGIVEPYFLDRNLTANASIFSIRSNRISAYETQSIGFRGGIRYVLAPFWFQSFNYRFSFEKIKGKITWTDPYLVSQNTDTTISQLTHAITYDTRNNYYMPSRGVRTELSTGYAGFLGGGVQFLQNVFSSAWYYPVAPEVTFMTKGEIGHLQRLNRNIRPVDRFKLGAQEFRGFGYGEIGPKSQNITNPSIECDWLGGTRYWKTTFQLVFPIGLPNEFGVMGAVFSDIGSVWRVGEKSPKTYNGQTFKIANDSHSIRVSAGFGITCDSPFGPLSLDYTYIVKSKSTDSGQRFLFGITTRF